MQIFVVLVTFPVTMLFSCVVKFALAVPCAIKNAKICCIGYFPCNYVV